MVGYEASFIARSRCCAVRRTGSRRTNIVQVDDPIDGRHSGDKGYPVEQLKQLCCMTIWDSTLTGNSASRLTFVCPCTAGWDNDSQTL